MDKTQQVAQLRLAADLLETGHPWETSHTGDRWWTATPSDNPAIHVVNNQHIRPVLATPPDGRPLHNPDNLTAEQVGAGWRLTLAGEEPHDEAKMWMPGSKTWQERGIKTDPYRESYTYCVPLSVPWPEAPKPEPAFQLPPPPPGIQWHKKDGWEEGDLPQGWRPLVVGEEEHDEDEFGSRINNAWMPTPDSGKVVGAYYKVRTRRPLTFNHADKTWTYHRPGDPMPCDGNAQIEVFRRTLSESADFTYDVRQASVSNWDKDTTVIGWRYADEKKTVPLGPGDVPPGSVFRRMSWDAEWVSISQLTLGFVVFLGNEEHRTFTELEEEWQINRSIPLTGKWNPDAWEPCSKSS